GYSVLDRARQQAETFRMIAVEKWITFLMLVFILLIASFNIVSTLSLMVIEKRDNMVTLRSLGATRRMVSGIFVAEGWLITAVGGVAGTLLGVALVLLQQHFGLIKLAADPSALTIDVYPVRLMWHDVALVLVTVCVTGFAIAQISRIFTRKIN
ncbi:MAG: FtsX-like permease family protein, partial [Muribaculaceae bacterium]|nr:FtsX-like permease family protein [Muribaculaceae bacterium]